jgi:sugar lactone lactonase YvrE
VTSARQRRDADELARLPHSGGIFALTVDVPGRAEPMFAG